MEFSPNLSWGQENGEGGKRAEGRESKKEGKQGFGFFFIKGNLLLGHARSEPVKGEAPEEAWQTVTR